MQKKLYDLTSPQKSIWYTEEVFKGTPIENITGTAIILNKVDFKLLEKSLNLFVQKNDGFRLKFILENGNVKQFVSEFTSFNVDKVLLSNESELKALEKELTSIPFNTINSLLFNFKMFEFPDGHGGFVIVMHHLISDAWTSGILVSEIINLYAALLKNEEIPATNSPSYIDYISSEQEYLNSDKFKKDEKFWNDTFASVPEVATVPSLNNNADSLSCKAKRKQFVIPKSTMDLINEFCKSHKVSAFNFFMGILAIYLGRVSNLDEFVIGTPVLNRSNFKEKHTAGMFISVVPFKITINHEYKFADFLSKISTDFFNIFRHQKYSYQYLLDNLRKQDNSIPHLYNILMSYQNMRSNKQSAEVQYEARWSFNNNISDDMEIHFFDINDTGDIDIAYDYKTAKYSKEDIFALHSRIINIINQVLNNEEILLKEIEIVTPDEKNKILYEFNNTKTDYPKDKTIVELFEEQVEKTPDNIAVVFEDQKLTYRELNEKSNSLGNYLRNNDIGRNDIVGIMVSRSLEMIVSILAVLKSGGTYIPIDPTYPKDRIEYMLSNSNAKFVLTQEKLKNNINFKNIITVDLNNKNIYNLDKNNLKNINKPDDSSYIIYTSGSTGLPKGVVLTHMALSNLTNYCNNYIEYLKNNSYRTVVSITTVSFDIFIFETLISLQKGLKLIIANENEQTIPRLLNDLIKKNNIEIIQSTPSRMQLLVNNIQDIPELKSLKFITLAGEQLPLHLVQALKKISSATIYNGYGPSETTVFSTLTEMNDKTITIGKPLDNTQIYILDKNLKPVPLEIAGELYISGDGVGKEYLNNSELTEKSFISNPFIDGTIMYKTGDLGRYTPEGNIICLGRCDNQVKIRGLRIELGEIEKKILENSNIASCVVAKKVDEISSHEFLCAYYTSKKAIDEKALRLHLQKALPNYMVPQYFCELQKLPYTPNGKVDIKKLPAPKIEANNKNIILPKNDIESKLVTSLKTLLNIKEISMDDNFFELGGDSLSAINLCTQIHSEFNSELYVKDILEHPSIQEISDIIANNTNKTSALEIKPVEKMEYYPASSAQKRMYLSSAVSGENSILYNIPGGVILDKVPDTKKLEDCFNTLINRHESLRTYFVLKNDNVVQKIEDTIDFKLEIDKTITSENNLRVSYDAFVKPFDLSKAPLFRAKLVYLENNKALLFVDMHHIISDGTSLSIFINELCKLYNDEALPELSITYKDFACYENEQITSGKLKEAEEFWVNQFKDDIPVFNMPTNFPRPAVKSFEGNKIYSKFDEQTTTKINEICKKFEITPYMLLLSVYYVLLSKYTSQDEIVVGSPIVGRNVAELYNIIGMFVNSLPMKAKVNSNLSFKDFVNNIKNICLENYKYQDYPFDELVDKLNISKDTSRNPLFDTMFIYQNNGNPSITLGEINAKYYIPDSNISKFDLSLEIIPENNILNLSFEYCTKLFEKSFIENLSNHYSNILNIVLENLDVKLCDIDMLSEDERNKILYEFNNTKMDYPKDKTIVELFEEQVEKTPDNIAVVFEDQKLTYRELNEKANSLANYLKNNGIGKNDVVGIMLNRSLELIISILGILKSNGTYMLIDYKLPEERIIYMIKNSNCALLLTNTISCSMHEYKHFPCNIFNYIYENTCINNFHNLNIYNAENLSIIYTSGSTGTPKGVLVRIDSMVNLIWCYINYVEANLYDNFLSICNVSFDMFSVEILLPLVLGKKLFLANEEEQKNPIYMSNLIHKHNIEYMLSTPSKLDLLLLNNKTAESLQKIKCLQIGGEKLSISLLKKISAYTKETILYNAYGPTETTSCCSMKKIEDINSITIGKPLGNIQIYILNKDMNLCPCGVIGEICVSGNGVSNGYIKDTDLTNKVFIQNPFSTNTLLYRTGDLGYYTNNYEIQFIGRNDSQVKMRGLRIELSEIDSVICSFSNIEKSITIYHDSNLFTYFKSNQKINIGHLKTYIKRKLPSYMIPSHLIQVENFPITANGKIDSKKLISQSSILAKKIIIEPKNDTEKKLLKIFIDLLNTSSISTNDDFFEIGGDSLSSIKLSVEIFNVFNTEISVKEIFENSSVEKLAKLIDTTNTINIRKISKTPKSDNYLLSSAQKRMYLSSTMSGENSMLYNIPGGIILDKALDLDKLEECINTLIERHEALRTYFELENDNIVQKILDQIDFKLDVNKQKISYDNLKQEFDNFVKPFDLSKAPLFRVQYINLDDGRASLFVDMHHIISDGTSSFVFTNELCKLYNGKTLDKLNITYKDFAAWEANKLASGEFKKAENFWINQFTNDIPVLNMPTNYSRPAVKVYEGNKVYSKFDSKTTEKINNICKELGVTPYMLLLSIYYILLSKYTGQDEIVVGSPIVGRNTAELYNIIGMFVNSLPMKAKIDFNLSFKDFLSYVKKLCLDNYKYQDYPFDELVNKLNIPRDTSRNPLFDTMFIYQNNGNAAVNFDGINSEYYIPDTNISKFDLSLEIVPENDVLNVSFEYCTKLFNKAFIENLSNHYSNILNAVLDNLTIQLSTICMLSESEKNKILYEFNNTKMDYPKDKTIAQLFEEQVEKTPDNIAVIFENQKLTYMELNEKANSLANYLRNNGIERNNIVGIMVNRSLEMIISILAVLKSGGTYIPIDPEYPQDRIEYMLNNSNSKLLLTQKHLENTVSFEKKIFVDLSNSQIYSLDKNNLTNISQPEDLAYVIYTSGSTGLPKGVMLKQINIVNFIYGVIKELKFTSNDVIVSITTISFDIFVLESLLPLLNGIKIVIASEEAQTDIKLLNELCEKNNVTIIQTTPSRFQAILVDENTSTFIKSIKYALIGGEPFPEPLLKKLHSICNAKIFNMYGPTETAVWSSIKDLSSTEKITIGKPIANTQMYILDKFNNILPIGIPGELFISGDCVCKGYFNRPDLTQKAFVDNPFINNAIMYKTGDFCQMLSNGEIEYFERIDNQVKIRGLRIELGEIENKILSYPNIQKACVIKQTINNRDFLSAYFTVNKRINISELRKYLANYLPKYMVPSYFTILDKFPYTPNGKINKKALPLPKEILSSDKDKKYIAPKTELEKQFVSVWEQVLNIKPIGIDDNFFELGGDSILAMNLNIELKNITDSISYSDIFKFPTISELIKKTKAKDENYDFKYMEKNYNKYSNLLNQNSKAPSLFELKYIKPGNILLTGATGFLGIHILETFLKKEKGNIYCIVREEAGLTSQAKLHQKLNYYFGTKYDKLLGKRIFAITGDICKPGFGLDQETLLDLANNINVVINTAARVAHYGNYSDFYNTNVKSVKYAIDFCKSFNKKLYHISTLSVSGNDFNNNIKQTINSTKEFKENDLYIGQSLENVYIRSKFEAECLVLDSILEGLDAYILRVGNLMPRQKDGIFQENVLENAFINRIISFIKIGGIPDYLKDGYLEFTPIDTISNAILKLITYPNSHNRILHLFNHNHVYFDKCIKYFKNVNSDLKVLSDSEFTKLIKNTLKSKKKKEILNSIINDLDKDLHLIYKTDIIIKSEVTIKYLSKIGFTWSKISDKYITRFIELLRKVLYHD